MGPEKIFWGNDYKKIEIMPAWSWSLLPLKKVKEKGAQSNIPAKKKSIQQNPLFFDQQIVTQNLCQQVNTF